MKNKTDILIIGGGVAGLTLAKFLAEENIDFILLEDHKEFYKKCCGEGITYSLCGYEFFDLYESKKGIERITEKSIIRTKYGDIDAKITNINTNKKEVEKDLAKQAKRKGAEIWMGEKVEKLIENENKIIVLPQNIEAKIVVGADGINSLVRRFMNVKRPNFAIASTGYWKGEKPGDACIVEFKKSVAKYGYAWWFPRKTDWNIGIGTVKTELFKQQFENFKSGIQMLKNGEQI